MRKPKILIFDLETSDLQADIGHIISIGYKWYGEGKATVISLLDFPGKTINDDSRLIEAFTKTYEQADATVAHFGEYFDVAFLQTRRLIHGMKPLEKVTLIDTWRIAKKKLKFGSNRLERILEVLGCPYKKSPVKLSVWANARCGDKDAIKYVIKHNLLDVLVLEWVYRKLRPFWERHPALYSSNNPRHCPACGSNTVKSNGRRWVSEKYHYQRLVCLKCGRSFKGPKVVEQ